MRFPSFDQTETLRQTWTDRFVRTRAGRPEYARFEGKIGRVVTVNTSGRALVDFADGAWYDIPADEDHLEIVPDDEANIPFDAAYNSAQKYPTRQS